MMDFHLFYFSTLIFKSSKSGCTEDDSATARPQFVFIKMINNRDSFVIFFFSEKKTNNFDLSLNIMVQ